MHLDSCKICYLVTDTGGTTVGRQRSLVALCPTTGPHTGAVGAGAAGAAVGVAGVGCAYAAFVAVLCVVTRAG